MRALLGAIRTVVVHLALLALGCWAVWTQFVYRAPSRYVTMVLAVLTLASTGLTLAFWLHAILRGIGATDRQLASIGSGQKVCALTTLAFTFYGLLLFSNGKFDLTDPVHHRTHIVSIGMEETELGVRVPAVWADVRSWTGSGGIERILLRPDERRRLWGGQAVVVGVKRGSYGISWVSSIEADIEERSLATLARFPDAGQIRKDLALFYMRLERFADAATTTRDYARRFPPDRDFPVYIARSLTSRDRFADVITTLSEVARRHEDANVYMLLGYSLGMHRRSPEGVRLLERARAMQPDDWWPHYALGWVYIATGDSGRGLASLEQAVKRRSGLYDAEREIERLRPIVARPVNR